MANTDRLVRRFDSRRRPVGRYCQNRASGLSPSHDAQDLALCLFSQSILRQKDCELMLEENLPMMVLAEHQQISYHTINNFRSSDHANELVKKSFLYFTNLLEQEGLINEGAIFIDGTKIEADANRYSFRLAQGS